MNPDGLSYLDLASAALNGGPCRLLNTYWSPAYPAIISLALRFFRPLPSQEVPIVHLVNFVIFAFAVWAFTVFIRSLLAVVRAPSGAIGDDEQRSIAAFFFCTFLYFSLVFIGVDVVTPDLLVAGIVFLAAASSIRFALPGKMWRDYAAFGVLLGAGYYVKAAMFPLGVLLFAILFIVPPSTDVPRRLLLLSFAIFALVALPLVAAMSVRANRLTFGDAGRLNYIWYANGLHWTDGLKNPDQGWTREHPAPKLLSKPLTYIYASPVGGTYPIWYDPSYWYRDSKPRFILWAQIVAIKNTILSYMNMARYMAAFILGSISLWGLTIYYRLRAGIPRSLRPMIYWSLSAVGLYAFVHVEGRFVGAFFALLWSGIYGHLIGRLRRRSAVIICKTVFILIMLPFTVGLAAKSIGLVRDLALSRPPDYAQVAKALREFGLRPGDNLAVVGYAYDCYYARYNRMRVVAQIPDASEFWHLSQPEVRSAAAALASSNVKAILAFNRPYTTEAADWKDVRISDSLQLSVMTLSTGVKIRR